MMKKAKIAIVSALLCLGLAACGSGSENNNSVNKNSEKTQTEAGYVYVSGSTEIAIDADFAKTAEALGEPVHYFEAASCAFDGLDKTYTYDGFTVVTYPDDNKNDLVSSITLNDDTVETKEGVSLGASKDDVTKAYGEPTSQNDTTLTYEKGNMKLLFIMEDGTVKSIQYLSKVLD